MNIKEIGLIEALSKQIFEWNPQTDPSFIQAGVRKKGMAILLASLPFTLDEVPAGTAKDTAIYFNIETNHWTICSSSDNQQTYKGTFDNPTILENTYPAANQNIGSTADVQSTGTKWFVNTSYVWQNSGSSGDLQSLKINNLLSEFSTTMQKSQAASNIDVYQKTDVDTVLDTKVNKINIIEKTVGSASKTITQTINEQGQVTSVTDQDILILSTQVTDFIEASQDVIGGALLDTSTIDLTYNDTTNKISADVKDLSLTDSKIATNADISTSKIKQETITPTDAIFVNGDKQNEINNKSQGQHDAIRTLATHSNRSILDNTEVSLTNALSGNYNTSYTHSQQTGNPHNTAISDIAGLALSLDSKELSANKTSTFSATPGNVKFPDEKLVKDSLDLKVDKVANKSLISNSEVERLLTMETGAEVNVQADYAQTDNTQDNFIKNKPAFGTVASKNVGTAVGNIQENGAELGASQIVLTDADKKFKTEAKATGYNLPLGTTAGTVVEGGTVYIKSEVDNLLQNTEDKFEIGRRIAKQYSSELYDVTAYLKGLTYTNVSTEAQLLAAILVEGFVIKLTNNITVASQINFAQKGVLHLNGFTINASVPTVVVNITKAVIISGGTLSHEKLTDTSIEVLVKINTPVNERAILHNLTLKHVEFAVELNGCWALQNVNFEYNTPFGTATDSHRHIAIKTVLGDCFIDNITFSGIPQIATTRYTNFILADITEWTGNLHIRNIKQSAVGALRQFLNFQTLGANVTAGKLIVQDCNFNDLNGGIFFLTAGALDKMEYIVLTNNEQGGDAIGVFKGFLYFSFTGALGTKAKIIHYNNKTLAGELRSDYVSLIPTADTENSGIVARQNTVTINAGQEYAVANKSIIETFYQDFYRKGENDVALNTKQNITDNTLNTTSKTIVGGINELKLNIDGKVSDTITNDVINIAPSQNAVFDALALKASLSSPALTGTPTAPTATPGTSNTQLANTEYTMNAFNVLRGAPTTAGYTLEQLEDRIILLEALLSTASDGDNVIDTYYELLQAAQNFPEGSTFLSELNKRALFGTLANRPSASAINNGYVYTLTDGASTTGSVFVSNGSEWVQVSYSKTEMDTLLDSKQAIDSTLTALAALDGVTGFLAQTGTDLFAKRTITSAGGISVTNGDGVAGNVTISPTYGSLANTIAQGNDGRLGTKAIDESAIANNKIQVYNSATGKLEYQDKPTGSTNLSIANKTATTLDIASDNGNDATVPQATTTEAGLLIASDKVKLNNTTGTNSGDQDLSGLLTKADNLASVANQQTALNNITAVSAASTGQALVKKADGSAGFENLATAQNLIASYTSAERDALTWSTGNVIYNTTYFRLEKYNGTSWVSADGTVGMFAFFDSDVIPLHYILCDASQVPRTGVYSELWALNSSPNPNLVPATFTITIATPAVITKTGHGLTNSQRVRFTTTGALPTGVTTGFDYIVSVIDANTFRISTSPQNAFAGIYVATSGTQSGGHNYTNTLYGQGDGTNQNTPDGRGVFLRSTDSSRLINSALFSENGSLQGDAIRNITGKVKIGFETNPSPTGAFYESNITGDGVSGGGTYFSNINFDASRVVPTADENRPKSYSSTLCIKYI